MTAKVLNPVSGIFAYTLTLSDGVYSLHPAMVVVGRAETGALDAWIATLENDRKGATVPGVAWETADLTSPVYYTFGSVARAARKCKTAVVLGRPVEIPARSRFGVELARLSGTDLKGIVLADWRVESHDAHKAGYTLKSVMAALRRTYAQ